MQVTVRRAWIAWGIAASAYLVDLLHRMSLGVASLDAEQRLGVGAGAVTILVALQLVVYVLGQVPAGLLADRIGPRRTLVAGLAVMTVGEALFALSHGFGLSLLGRLLIGAGDATIFLSVLRVAAHWFPRRQFGLVTALTAMAGCVGQLASTTPLTLALQGPGWTATFGAIAVLTAVVAVLVARTLQERPPQTAAPGRHEHPPVLSGLRAAWSHPGTRRGCLTHFALMTPFGVLASLWGHPYLVEVAGLSDATASTVLLAGVAASGAAAPMFGALVTRRPDLRARAAFATSVAITGAVAGILALSAGAPAVVFGALFAVAALGMPGSMLGFDIAQREDDGRNGGAVTALVNLGGWSGTVVLQGVLALSHGLTVSRWMLLPLLLVSALSALRLAAYCDWRATAVRVRERLVTA